MPPVLAGSNRGAFVFVSCPMDLNPHSQLVNHAIISIMISKAFSGNCRIAISKYLGNGCFECYYNNNDGLSCAVRLHKQAGHAFKHTTDVTLEAQRTQPDCKVCERRVSRGGQTQRDRGRE